MSATETFGADVSGMGKIEAGCMIVGALLVGIVGTYNYMRDKTVVSTGVGATFDLYWKIFATFLAIGGAIGYFIGTILNKFGVYIAGGPAVLAILFAAKGNELEEGDDKQKQYMIAGVTLLPAIGLFLATGIDDKPTATRKPVESRQSIERPVERQQPSKPAVIDPALDDDAFDGEQYGLNNLSDEEVSRVHEFKNNGWIDRKIADWIRMARRDSGGVPLGQTNNVIAPGRQLGSDDLRLGDISIEEDAMSVLYKLGEPAKRETKPDGVTFLYELGSGTGASLMDITIKESGDNAFVNTIVALGPNITTPRGVAPSGKLCLGTNSAKDWNNSSRSDVTSFYGVGYKQSQYENLDLYEYEIASESGQPCVLRFAVNRSDNRVDYISIRHK